MSLTADILDSYRAPRQVLRRHLEGGAGEGRALVFLMLGLGLLFVSQWPRLAREAALDPQIPLDARIAGAFFGWLCLAPLLLYGLAAASRIVARALGLGLDWFGARLALFWAVLAASPLALLQALLSGFAGGGAAVGAVGLVGLGIFLYLWFAGLGEAGRKPGRASVGQQG